MVTLIIFHENCTTHIADAMGFPSLHPSMTLRPCSEIADAIVATGRRALEEVPWGISWDFTLR